MENQPPVPFGPSFGLIEVPARQRIRRRWALGISTGAQIIFVAALARSVTAPPSPLPFPPEHRLVLTLLVPPPLRMTPHLSPPPEKRVDPPPPRRLAALPPPPPPPMAVARPITAVPLRPRPVLLPVVPLPLPEMQIAPPPPTPVRLDGFTAATAKPAPDPPRAAHFAAHFGDPQLRLAPRTAPANVAAAGFDAAAAGSAESGHGAQAVRSSGFGTSMATAAATGTGTVASSGFGQTATGLPLASAGGMVRTSGFGARAAAAPPSPSRPAAAPVTTPVEILSKPNPDYTAEARRLHIEGEVVLQVEFGADGRLRVQRVVQGLGHGLDEAAVRAAEEVQFRPASRDGSPVETAAVIRVTFQLAQ